MLQLVSPPLCHCVAPPAICFYNPHSTPTQCSCSYCVCVCLFVCVTLCVCVCVVELVYLAQWAESWVVVQLVQRHALVQLACLVASVLCGSRSSGISLHLHQKKSTDVRKKRTCSHAFLQVYMHIFTQIIWFCFSISYLDLSCDIDQILGCFDIWFAQSNDTFQVACSQEVLQFWATQ